MKRPITARLLRAAAVLAFLQYSAHTLLFLSAAPTHGRDEIAVVNAMKSYRFNVGGFSRSYWDFYFGYGLLAILTGVIEVVLLWQTAAMAKADAHRVRPMVALWIIANLAHALVCWRYFFIKPIVPDLVIALCLALAFLAAGKGSPEVAKS